MVPLKTFVAELQRAARYLEHDHEAESGKSLFAVKEPTVYV